MNIQIFKEYDLAEKLGQVRACEAKLSNGGTGMLFAYSKEEILDPFEGTFTFHKSPMKLAMFSEKGQMLWHKTLGMGLVPGTWFMPFISFDLNNDGADEIWFLNNPTEYPFNARGMVLEGLDSMSGKTICTMPFHAENTEWEQVSHAYRFLIFAGYAHGESVLVTAQGIYGEIFMQAYNSDMSLRWETKIAKDEGSCGSHSVPVFDFNNDGVDEVLYGEHMISLDDGSELLCLDKDCYFGHSDIVLPFTDYKSGKLYFYTCREGGDYDGCPRVAAFDSNGRRIWEDLYSDEWGHYIDDGHIHFGWVANMRPDYRKVAFAYRRRERKKIYECHVYDAVTGEPIEMDFPQKLNLMRPIDINGDGYHEFLYWDEGHDDTAVIDSDGKEVYRTGGILIHIGKHYDYSGEQFMVWYPEEGKVRIWGDADAAESEMFQKRYSNGFLKNSMKIKGCGYNWLTSVDCAF